MKRKLHSLSIPLAAILLFAGTFRAAAQTSCQAAFTFSVLQGTLLQFNDTSFASPGTVTAWSWSFGDGTGSTQQNPAHTFNGMGTYTVCLTITTSMGCVDSTCQVITIGAGCPMTVAVVPDTNNATLQAVVTGGNPPYQYLWSTGATTAVINTAGGGQYCVTVTDSNNCTAYGCYTVPSTTCAVNATFSNVGGGTIHFYGTVTGNYSYFTWNFGDGDTSSQASPFHTYAQPGVYVACLTAFDSLGNSCSTYCLSVSIAATPTDTICGTVFWDLNGNGVLDPGETGIAGGFVLVLGNGLQYTAPIDSNGYYYAPVLPGTYTLMYCTSPGNVFSIPLNVDSNGCAYYTVTVPSGTGGCGYNFGVQNTAVTIEGTLFIDANNNGVLDAGESGIPYQAVSVGGYTAFSNPQGQYSVNVPAGTYTVSYSPQGVYAPYALTTPGSISVNATTVGNTYGGNHFGLYIPPGTVNLSVNLIPHTTVTPGHPAWYSVQVCNIGLIPTAATLTMNYDPGLTLDYSQPAAASNNTVNHILTWNLAVINPGSCINVWVDFDASTSYVVGSNTFEFVSVLPVTGTDIDLSNNTDTVHQVVTASWDPNNKLSIQTNNINPNEQIVSAVNPDQEIVYTVNFQNTGTAPAVNVVVDDALSPDLDAASFQLVGTSHPCSVTRFGSQVQYVFSQIMLPDSATNEPGSHGFVCFRVSAVNGLAAGHVISDEAAIYFDFNIPVITNFSTVTMVNPLGIGESAGGPHHLQAYPNPSDGHTSLSFRLDSPGDVRLDLVDGTGRKVRSVEAGRLDAGSHTLTVDATGLPAGLYLLRLQTPAGASTFKITKL